MPERLKHVAPGIPGWKHCCWIPSSPVIELMKYAPEQRPLAGRQPTASRSWLDGQIRWMNHSSCPNSARSRLVQTYKYSSGSCLTGWQLCWVRSEIAEPRPAQATVVSMTDRLSSVEW